MIPASTEPTTPAAEPGENLRGSTLRPPGGVGRRMWRRGVGWGAWVGLAVVAIAWNWPREEGALLRNRLVNTHAVERLGYGGYLAFDVADMAVRWWQRARVWQVDPAPYRAYLAAVAARRASPVAGDREAPRKHVIYLQLESVDGLVIGARRGGRPLMPFLEGLARGQIWFRNVVDNTASGRTTDGEFLVLTSTVPLPRPPVFVSQRLDRLPSLPRELKAAGYRTVSLHGFNRMFWRRDEAHAALGIDERYFEDDLNLTDRIGWGVSDRAILEEAARRVIEAEQGGGPPLFLHVITLTNHHPYDHVAKARGLAPDRIEVEYARSVAYVDEALAEFFTRLREAGALENCLIAIYGDHDSAISRNLERFSDRFAAQVLPDTVPLVLAGFDRPPQRVVAFAGLQDLPVMVLEELGLPVPHTFTGNGWQQWGRTIGALHGAVESAPGGGWRPWDPGIDQQLLTRLIINRPKDLLP